ncbi:four-helix bundle copper-binding protein [Rhodohalobacter sp. 614A]|uniref:four-helix bundle copper-binding protein n=1 Tax=Rhodohalobacter sp. 614A TaxID=2908649 RepID=UPI001F3E2AAD|nr:four-helix bundle copper-binding protein [Rhodohalobacter sp. 614A]
MNNYEEIISALSECITACETCFAACLEEDHVEEMTECIKLDRDCAEMCRLAVQFLSRDSDISQSIIGLCADICAKCAEECEKHDHDHCQKCAEACRNCEEICKIYLDNVRQAAMNT